VDELMQKSLNGLRVSNLAQIILGLGCAFALAICRPEPSFEKVETGFRNAQIKQIEHIQFLMI
jgi:hypothetical protein